MRREAAGLGPLGVEKESYGERGLSAGLDCDLAPLRCSRRDPGKDWNYSELSVILLGCTS